jgi:hypothetical protein
MNVRVGILKDDGLIVDLDKNLSGANAEAPEKLVEVDKKLDRISAAAILIFIVVRCSSRTNDIYKLLCKQ